MLNYFLASLAHEHTIFNIFRYITFRTGGALMTSLLLSFWIGPRFIKWLKQKQREGQPIREDGPESHLITKKGTPTMGGALMLISLTVSTLLWGQLNNVYVWVTLGVTLGFGTLGAMDDFLKLSRRTSKGLSGKRKLLGQLIIAGFALWLIQMNSPVDFSYKLAIPFFKTILLDLGWFFFPFGACVIIGASNAVNLTDGLDGLAVGPIMIAALSFALISYLVGNTVFAHYLQIHFIPGAGELAIICAAIVGSGLGFLWFNAPPAQVFMGDTGSLAMGGALGTMSVITKHELVLFVIGGLFVIETISVILQVASFKMTGQRIFLMAPIHHHFEKKGWAEQTIVIRFWIIAIIFALIGLSTLKLR